MVLVGLISGLIIFLDYIVRTTASPIGNDIESNAYSVSNLRFPVVTVCVEQEHDPRQYSSRVLDRLRFNCDVSGAGAVRDCDDGGAAIDSPCPGSQCRGVPSKNGDAGGKWYAQQKSQRREENQCHCHSARERPLGSPYRHGIGDAR